MPWFILYLLVLVPRAPAVEKPDAADPLAASHRSAGVYEGEQDWQRYKWGTYGHRYDKPNYGHKFIWSRAGLSAMSICLEVDSETGGDRYQRLSVDGYCPKIATRYRWGIPYDGQPSHCLNVDTITDGERFERIVDDGQCPKPTTTFAWERKSPAQPPQCVEMGDSRQGDHYYRPVAEHLCLHTLDVYVAYGAKKPYIPNRQPASRGSVTDSIEKDPRFFEDAKSLGYEQDLPEPLENRAPIYDPPR